MSEPKPFASLSSGLLARKGAAKPAMRPQGYGTFGHSLEDLGWDDMGYAAPQPTEHVPSSISALTPAPGGRSHYDQPHVHDEEEADEQADWSPEEAFEHPAQEEEFEEPAVIGQQRALEQSFEPEQPEAQEHGGQFEPTEPAAEPAPVVTLPKRKPVAIVAPPPPPARAARPVAVDLPARAKAAFTLRLDPDRHLRLRLATAVTRRSAQQIVTGALDEYLNSLPELDALAEHVPVKAGKR
ncbi:MAG TPA: hypothetical protein VIT45_14040 [Allosphingosinicella sp.]